MPSSQQAVLNGPDVARYVSTMPSAETADLVGKLLSRPGPAPRGTRRVMELFQKNIVFESRADLARRLDGMKPHVLNSILIRLVSEGKVLLDNDGALVWIHVAGNKKLMEAWGRARPLPPRPGKPRLP